MNKLVITRDVMAESPREWCNLGTMVCWHPRYTLGDEQPLIDPEEFVRELSEGTLKLPLYLYDHSGIVIQTTPFNCIWDSGQVGWIYATQEQLKKEYGDHIDLEGAKQVLEREVKVYDQFLRGSVWGFVVESKCSECEQETEIEDSCFGFIGDTLEETGIRTELGKKYLPQLEKAWEERL